MSSADSSRPDYEPGDLVVFAGRSCTSRLIALRTCPPICWWRGWLDSHIGIIGVYAGETHLFESTTLSDLPCSITGKNIRGVKAVNPHARAATYDGLVWRLPLRNSLNAGNSSVLTGALVNAIGAPYEDLASLALVGARFLKRHWLFRADTSRLFCSELVAMVLEIILRLPPGNASIWTPSGLARRVVWQGTHGPRERVN